MLCVVSVCFTVSPDYGTVEDNGLAMHSTLYLSLHFARRYAALCFGNDACNHTQCKPQCNSHRLAHLAAHTPCARGAQVKSYSQRKLVTAMTRNADDENAEVH